MGNNYLKLRRDEFDVLTGSSRKGYRNREPIPTVLEIHNTLRNIDLQDFTAIIKSIVSEQSGIISPPFVSQEAPIEALSESDIEEWINATDSTAARVKKLVPDSIGFIIKI